MNSLLTQDVQPSRVASALLNRWPIIFALGVFGGLIGLGVSWVMPPVYQATATVSIGVDPSQANPYSANVQYEANLRTQDLFLSDSTLNEAAAKLAPRLAGSSASDFRSQLRLDHVKSEWYLRAAAGSPSDAAERANAWASAATDAFETAQVHAIKAGEFQALLFSVACTPEAVLSKGGSNIWSCDEMSLDVDPDQVSAGLLAEARLSHGILPGQTISTTELAQPPDGPVRGPRALLALSGTLAGLVLGLLAALTGRLALGPARANPGSE